MNRCNIPVHASVVQLCGSPDESPRPLQSTAVDFKVRPALRRALFDERSYCRERYKSACLQLQYEYVVAVDYHIMIGLRWNKSAKVLAGFVTIQRRIKKRRFALEMVVLRVIYIMTDPGLCQSVLHQGVVNSRKNNTRTRGITSGSRQTWGVVTAVIVRPRHFTKDATLSTILCVCAVGRYSAMKSGVICEHHASCIMCVFMIRVL